MSKASALEDAMHLHLRAYSLTAGMEREHRFDPTRRWRFDFAWPEKRVAIEVEGGIWTSGRHTSAVGWIGDAEKYNRATILGWRILRVATNHIKSGEAVQWARELLGAA